jgi:hypothetical protein
MSRAATAIGEALSAKGVFRHNIEFQIAISKFQNNGGEYGVALAMLNAAYGRSEGHGSDDGHIGSADASCPARAEMPTRPAHHRPARAWRGQHQRVQHAAKSLFDSIVPPDGRRPREVRWGECRSWRRAISGPRASSWRAATRFAGPRRNARPSCRERTGAHRRVERLNAVIETEGHHGRAGNGCHPAFDARGPSAFAHADAEVPARNHSRANSTCLPRPMRIALDARASRLPNRPVVCARAPPFEGHVGRACKTGTSLGARASGKDGAAPRKNPRGPDWRCRQRPYRYCPRAAAHRFCR